ncbi:MAG: ribose-phosphate pyrophosphokinase-like domain-containing protein, partial [Nanoarchaeota archaeon]|nr:ribose-phosphate pyrophosphokinase-like domain-containing protein [Nanoarchaeota archaeon]
MAKRICLIAGSANPVLAKEISKYLNIPLTPADVKKFNDGESYVHIEKSVRGSDVFVIQPTSPDVNDHMMELLIMLDALKRASAHEITAIIPYYGYSRQDRKAAAREPISAKLIADLLTKAGADRV